MRYGLAMLPHRRSRESTPRPPGGPALPTADPAAAPGIYFANGAWRAAGHFTRRIRMPASRHFWRRMSWRSRILAGVPPTALRQSIERGKTDSAWVATGGDGTVHCLSFALGIRVEVLHARGRPRERRGGSGERILPAESPGAAAEGGELGRVEPVSDRGIDAR